MDKYAVVAKDAIDVEDITKQKFVLEAIRDEPRLAQQYMDVLSSLYKDNEHKFSTIERDMFASLKVLFNKLYSKAVTDDYDGMDEYKDYMTLVKTIKELYDVLNRSLQNARVKGRTEDLDLTGLPTIDINDVEEKKEDGV